MTSLRVTRAAFLAASALSLAACSDQATAPASVLSPAAPSLAVVIGTPPTVRRDLEGQVWVCKTANVGAPQATFSYSYSATKPAGSTQPDLAPGNFTMQNGECAMIYAIDREARVGRYVVTVTEGAMPNAEWSFGSASAATIAPFNAAYLGTGAVVGQTISDVGFIHDQGVVITFNNVHTPPSGQLGDFVWNDVNGNGVQDAGEPGIAGVTVTLSGAASATTTTDANGAYLFSGLSAGSYTVAVDATTLPAGFVATQTGQGTTATDNNGSPANASLATNSSQDLTIDFGYLLPAPPPPPPPAGCTLTQGYWKTHNDSFKGGAKADATWQLVGPLAEGETFYLSGKSWFGVFNTAPAGNQYYNLAHQYMAAKLNVLGGAGTTTAVTNAIAQAEALFASYTPAQIAALKGNAAPRPTFVTLAGILGSYNEGATGPGHCD